MGTDLFSKPSIATISCNIDFQNVFYRSSFDPHPNICRKLAYVHGIYRPALLLDQSWATPGSLLDHSWISPGSLLDHSWISPGPLLDNS